ncbi:MAG: tRNA (guanosine(37)-N1)-methyltransferase TrmD [Candidatus Omnitrophica bacterium CG11_big_fil_rev_8_21_14_0_20_42_13]|uniref:tRNA (guanine-N(1)-)-methyltransferase n=1 Tax=Candidatus Ghiorseimicrobium undicola TaxID=1974746 RepID=A0A2H0LZG7_9BACT|nr:MAG: tRNA (guanosine(37)-N1)-methyltransferase TrmD [Candidatus Omnitrophica bacterium CG11_big_fil_rev_8_21_14_0_20_42_13]
MRIDVVTIFPEMFEPVLGQSIIKRARNKGRVEIKIHNLRQYTKDKHKKVDDRPYGGGPGMVMMPQPIFDAVRRLKQKSDKLKNKPRIILLSPQGKKLTQKLAKKLSADRHLILICGHYEGVDERVMKHLVTDEVSIGDYVLTGGELPAMVLIDTVVRLLPGVLGRSSSKDVESFEEGLLEYPQYTRPAEINNYKVPEVLLSGNHARINQWRKKQALKVTRKKRPDLLKNV